MKLEDFVLDKFSNVYVNSDELTQVHYFDGAENYLREVLLSAQDLGLLSIELNLKIKDWPSLYHLSPYRVTIMDCFDFLNRDAEVLELGAGCGAITRWLGEHFKSVYAVEGSFQRASLARLRCRDLENVRLYAANFFDLDLKNKFDIVTLIGVLEYSHLYHPEYNHNPYEASMASLKSAFCALKDHGVLLLAIENKLGLKYFSGAKEDHSGKIFNGIQGYPDPSTPVTFSCAELDHLLQTAGFTTAEFYLPFPDYKLAKTIINAQALTSNHYYIHNWVETPFPDRVTEQRTLLFNESLALREISKAGLLRDLSNSFLVIAYKGDRKKVHEKLGLAANDWIARHYSLDRYSNFCKKVTLAKNTSGLLQVENRLVFDSVYRANVFSPVFKQTFTTEQLYHGNLLHFTIFEMIATGKFEISFQPLLEKMNTFLLEHFSAGNNDEIGIPLLSGDSLDVTFWNIIVEEKTGRWIFIDREWTFNGSIPADFIIWRSLYHLFLRYRQYLEQFQPVKTPDELASEWLQNIYPSCSLNRIELARQFDQTFQDFVNFGISNEEPVRIIDNLLKKSNQLENAVKPIDDQTHPQVSIIIPTYNNLQLTRQCLDAVRQTTDAVKYEIIIVDNGSTDGTPDYLYHEQNTGRLKFIQNKENLGFAKACNQGAQAASGDYLLFLNNDTVPKPGWLKSLVIILDQDNSVAVAGSKLLFPDGTIQHAGVIIIDDRIVSPCDLRPDPLVARHIYYKHPADLADSNQLRTYQAITAACLLVRRVAFEQVGGFDEEYWNGYEDVDLCFKLQEKKWKLVYQPDSIVIHYEYQSGKERFTKVQHNVNRLHNKWLGKIKPDVIIEKDGSIIETNAGKIKPYVIPQKSEPFVQQIPSEKKKGITSIIILTHNQLEHTEKCIESIKKFTPEPHEIIIVDNGSTDSTLEYLGAEMATNDNVRVIVNSTNRGFASGNNQGIALARGEYVLLLNNDTVVTEGWLGRMLNVFKRYPKTGIVGPMSNYVSGPQLVQKIDYKNLEELGAFAARRAKEYDGQSFPIYRVVGFCLLVRREVINRIGGLDEQFGSGNFEDDDFCIRAALAGHESRIAQDVFIHHTGSQTFKGAGINYGESLLRNWELFKAKWRVPIETPFREGYCIPVQTPPGLNLYIPLPDVLSDHAANEDKRWLKDIGVQVPQKQITPGLTSIIVLTSDRFSNTKKCIKSIRKNTPEPHEVIVTDDGSSLKTTSWLRKRANEDADFRLISGGNPTPPPLQKRGNRFEALAKGGNKFESSEKGRAFEGYVKALNQGINESVGEYIVILTDDVVVTKGWLSGMLECLKSAPDVGIVGPMTVDVDGPQRVITTDYSSLEYLDQFAQAFREKNRYRRVPARKLNGCCMLFKHEFIEKAGMVDERFDSYEVAVEDLCFRSAMEGYRNLIAADVFLHHYADGGSPEEKDAAAALRFRNRDLLMRKWSEADTATRIKLSAVNALHTAEELAHMGHLENAFTTLIEGIKLNVDDASLHYTLAEILIDNGKFAEALGILQNMPERIRQGSRWLELVAECKAGMQMHQEAEELADKILSLHNASPVALNIKGLVALKKGLHADAQKFFEKALEYDRGFAKAYANIGRIKWLSNNKEGAYTYFEKAFILAPSSSDIVMSYYDAAVSLSKLERAESLLREASALYPSNKRLKFFIMDILLQTGRYAEAMTLMEDAMISFGIDEATLTVALEMRNRAGVKEIDKSSPDTISLCMIVKNEQDKIGHCLIKIKPAVDEMIIVDTGSADRTKDIATAFGAKVYDFKWSDNFADARNFSLSKASGRWILILDADEAISVSDHKKLKALVIPPHPSLAKGGRGDFQAKPDAERFAYSFVTRSYVTGMNVMEWRVNDGSYIAEEAGTGWFPGEKVRLFPNDSRIQFKFPVHEIIEPSLSGAGIPIRKCDIPIHHYGMLDEKKSASKGEMYYRLGEKRLAERGEGDIKALHDLAVQAAGIGRHEEALEYLKKIIGLKPDFPDAFKSMGNIYYNLGRYEEALSSYAKVIQLSPDSQEAMLMYLNCEICNGNIESALNLLEESSRKDPKYPKTMVALAIAYFCAGRKEKGLEYVNRLRDMRFICADYFSDFANKLISAQKLDYAILLLEAAVESNNINNATAALLAECHKMRQLNDGGYT